MIDVLTSNPFISGLSNKENPRDLLPTLDGKVYVVKARQQRFINQEMLYSVPTDPLNNAQVAELVDALA